MKIDASTDDRVRVPLADRNSASDGGHHASIDLLHGHETTLYGDKADQQESERKQWTAADANTSIGVGNRRCTR